METHRSIAHALARTCRAATAVLAALLVLTACRDVLAPEDVEGVYVLVRIGQVPMPGEITDATNGAYRVIHDTLELRRNGSARWSEHHESRPVGASDWLVRQIEQPWTFLIRGDEVRLRADGCPASPLPCATLPILHTKLRVVGSELHADGSAGVLVWTRVSAAAP
jgi:hypothetical protein